MARRGVKSWNKTWFYLVARTGVSFICAVFRPFKAIASAVHVPVSLVHRVRCCSAVERQSVCSLLLCDTFFVDESRFPKGQPGSLTDSLFEPETFWKRDISIR